MRSGKVRKPLTKGVAKVPVIMQLESLECGAASLAMVMAYYGKWVPLEQVRASCGVSRDGSNALNIWNAAEYYGFDVDAYRASPKELKEDGTFPCIIHWNMNHFLVLDGFRGKYAYLNDPARGVIRVTWDEFDKIPDGLFEVGACGFGCVLMKSEIFVAVFSKFGQMFTPIANCGEDIAFCWRARQCGYKILADPSIGLGHVGHTVITKEFFDNYQLTLKAKEERGE